MAEYFSSSLRMDGSLSYMNLEKEAYWWNFANLLSSAKSLNWYEYEKKELYKDLRLSMRTSKN